MVMVARDPNVDPNVTCIVLSLEETINLARLLKVIPEGGNSDAGILRDGILLEIRKTGLGV